MGFSYDLAGRVTSQLRPDSQRLSFGRDANGNVTSLIPPGRPAHRFSYGPDDLEEDYAPPGLAGVPRVNTSSQYNRDRQLSLLRFPDEVDEVMGRADG